jgi:uncharacterized protein YfaQ (DUF2300 family)
MANEVVSLRDERERTIAALSDFFAQGELDLGEFERRLTLAHRATSTAELAELLADAPEHKVEAVSAQATHAVVKVSGVRPKQWVVAFLGGARRGGTWTCARKLRVVAMMGGVELDFRDARLGPGVTEVWIVAMMGGVQIVVPPGLAVDAEGFGLMGGFDAIDRTPSVPDPERPLLRIRGFALMGGVEVKTRLLGGFRTARRLEREERPRLGEAYPGTLPRPEER